MILIYFLHLVRTVSLSFCFLILLTCSLELRMLGNGEWDACHGIVGFGVGICSCLTFWTEDWAWRI